MSLAGACRHVHDLSSCHRPPDNPIGDLSGTMTIPPGTAPGHRQPLAQFTTRILLHESRPPSGSGRGRQGPDAHPGQSLPLMITTHRGPPGLSRDSGSSPGAAPGCRPPGLPHHHPLPAGRGPRPHARSAAGRHRLRLGPGQGCRQEGPGRDACAQLPDPAR